MIGFEVTMGKTEQLADLGERSLTIAGYEVQNQIPRFSQEYQMTPDGALFQPLTNAYRHSKIRAGYAGVPNLTRTGGYMREIKARKVGDKIEVGPRSEYETIAQGLSSRREHIGIAPETPGIIESKLVEEFERMFQ